MIRWRFLLPRLIIIAVLLLGLTFGSAPLLRWGLVASGQAAIGAKVEIGDLQTSWWGGSVSIQEMAIADPRRPMSNLIEADLMQLDLDMAHLARKRLVVEHAQLEGVRFGGERQTSGALPNQDAPRQPTWIDPFIDQAEQAVDRRFNTWLEELETAGLRKLETELESVRIAQELAKRWPAEYANLRERVETIEDRFERVKGVVEQRNPNPLRMVQLYGEAAQEVQATLKDIEYLHGEVRRLARQIPVDKQLLVEAQQRDRGKLRSLIQLPKIDANVITEAVFGPEQGRQVHQIFDWVTWVRETVPNPDKDFRPEQRGGIDVHFAGVVESPTFWIKEAALSGILHHERGDSRAVPFIGTLRDLSSHPSRLTVPTRLELDLQGERPARMLATLDRTGSERRDHVVVELKEWTLPERRFGKAEAMTLVLPEGKATLALDLRLVEDQIDGKLVVIREGRGLEVTHVSDRLGGTYVHSVLGSTLESLDRYEATIELRGDLRRPDMQLHSPLGPQLATKLNAAVATIVADQLRRAEERLQRELAEGLAKMEGSIGEIRQLEELVRTYENQLGPLRQTVARISGFNGLR